MAKFKDIHAFQIVLRTPGCTDESAGNYDSAAEIDDGSCISLELYDCAINAIMSLDLGNCNNEKTEKALKLYTIYKAYKESLTKINNTKTSMYKQKLIDLCNCKTC